MRNPSKEELFQKIDKLASSSSKQKVACVEVMFLDDSNTLEVLISLYDSTPKGYDDDEIFYYCSGIDDLKSLCDQDCAEDCGEDFVITDVFSIC